MPRGSLRHVLLASALGAAAAGCTEGTGPGSLGQLRVRPVFAPGEEPATLGVSPSLIRIVLRDSDGGVVADTSLPYSVGDATSWLIELENPPEAVGISADLGQGSAIMYAGTGEVSLTEGIGSSGTEHDLLVRYVSGPAFTIDVSPDSARLDIPGGARQFEAVARDPAGAALAGFSYAWASSRPEIATVNAAGLVTAVAPGRVEITASSGGVTGSAIVIVADPAPASIVVTPDSGLISLGGSFQFKAVVRNAAGDVIPGAVPGWSSSRVDIATVGEGGLATGVAAGRAFIVARFGALADSAPLVVTDTRVGAILVTPPMATLTALGATQQFMAVALNSRGDTLRAVSFQWSSSSIDVATVNANGLATAVAAGTTAITASANGMTGSASLAVSLGVTRLVVVPQAATISVLGATQQFTAVALDILGRPIANAPVTWSTSNPAVASINAAGLATGIAAGQVTVTAISGLIRAEASLTVAPVVHSVVVSPPSAQVVKGESMSFTATAHDANGHVIPGAVFEWSTSNPAVATASSTGAVTGVSGGSAAVRATTAGVTGSSSVSVVVVGSVEILGEAEQHVNVGGTWQFVAVVRDAGGAILNGVSVTWSIDTPIASFISTGPLTSVVTGVTPGITFFRATAGNVSGVVELVVRP